MQLPRPGDTKYEVLKTVNERIATTGKPPTIAELRSEMGLSTRSGIQFHVNDLVEMGLLARLPNKVRGLRATNRGRNLVKMLDEAYMEIGAASGAVESER